MTALAPGSEGQGRGDDGTGQGLETHPRLQPWYVFFLLLTLLMLLTNRLCIVGTGNTAGPPPPSLLPP